MCVGQKIVELKHANLFGIPIMFIKLSLMTTLNNILKCIFVSLRRYELVDFSMS